MITAPAGSDRFVAEVGEPAGARVMPPLAPPDLDQINRLNLAAAKVGIEHLPPPA